ncbi:phosphonate C-P lyase system protein PhnH [Halodesulfovibrio marinisediminis]|uniref:Alpha-D-ribose 1-methylphosphonate 5-triphosphate synthase subunit PhnH n=1 Tax=Halodesulfovibrio marinisediminis DSM 17456 TaxID=1121457 RepID=A0A1N6DWS7_9BACT|nr:phosphonate C-P lyase system protein PhnH [Halodesulfovibrio marinisediminis]SIN75163.1 alpha-D-ribose 1-methylphosphonate 5-triphosphate synthase subunit PhnH [Halodesulfovibrio marinisediminis DSM 17456]
MNSQQILSGFINPVQNSQQWYRVILNAMSRPGNVYIPESIEAFSNNPKLCHKTTASIALTLFDNDTTIWLQSPEENLSRWLQFHCGCPLTDLPEEAAFALITDGSSLPDLTQFAIGTADFPDRSTTLIIQVSSLAEGDTIKLSGAGIATTKTLKVSGLNASFWNAQETNSALFPQGFDTILAAPDGVICIPRTITIRRQEPCM